MALGTVKDIAKAVNSFDFYSTEDQQALQAVIEDYFTNREDEDESELSLDSNGM